MLSDQEEMHFREAAFAWIRAQQLYTPFFTREDLSKFEYGGGQHRLIGPFTGIWKVASFRDSALAISTAFVPDGYLPRIVLITKVEFSFSRTPPALSAA